MNESLKRLLLIPNTGESTSGKWLFWNTIYGYGPESLTPYMTRIGIGRLRFHVFWRGDKDRAWHDHPWDFWTFPLAAYLEEVVTRWGTRNVDVSVQEVPAFRISYRPATHMHRVLKRSDGGDAPMLTVVWRGRSERPWGFLARRSGKFVWTPWKQFVNG